MQPGSYTVSGLSTITNALFVSGGVKKIGSLRDIELKRGGRTITKFDLYELLLSGDTQADLRPLSGDVIFIPPVGPVVGVDGEVRRPALYELRSERTVADIVKLAGGATAQAQGSLATIERVGDGGKRIVVDVDLIARRRQHDAAGRRHPAPSDDSSDARGRRGRARPRASPGRIPVSRRSAHQRRAADARRAEADGRPALPADPPRGVADASRRIRIGRPGRRSQQQRGRGGPRARAARPDLRVRSRDRSRPADAAAAARAASAVDAAAPTQRGQRGRPCQRSRASTRSSRACASAT